MTPLNSEEPDNGREFHRPVSSPLGGAKLPNQEVVKKIRPVCHTVPPKASAQRLHKSICMDGRN